MSDYSPDHPDLTAYALGEFDTEAHAATREQIEAFLRTSASARQLVLETRATAGLLAVGLQRVISPGLGEERLAALRDASMVTEDPALAAAATSEARADTDRSASEAESIPLVRLHREADADAEIDPSDEHEGTPLYHVITHPMAEPRHWRRTLLTVAAAVAIVASTLTAILASLLHRAGTPQRIARHDRIESPTPESVIIPTNELRDGPPGSMPEVPGMLWVGKPTSELIAEAYPHPPLIGPAAILTRLESPRPTTNPTATAEYALTLENPFLTVRAAPLSALPLQTGHGSYAAIKAAIASGHLPAKETVRVEELLNAFAYQDAAPVDGEAFTAHLEAASCPWNADHRLVRIAVRAREGASPMVIARAASVQVEFNPVTVEAYRLIGYDRRLTTQPQPPAAPDPSITAGHTVTALYEIIPASGDSAAALTPTLKYQTTAGLTAAAGRDELLTVAIRYREPADDQPRRLEFAVRDSGIGCGAASADFQFTAAVAAFGLVLRDSPHKGTATFETVLALAGNGLAGDELAARSEFVELVRKAKSLRAS